MDCVADDEKYLTTNTSFYNECTVSGSTQLATASEFACFDQRRCVNGAVSDDGKPFVGYDPTETCKCPVKKNIAPNKYSKPYASTLGRFKRQTGENRRCTSRQCRVLKGGLGGKRKACDKNCLVSTTGHTPARQHAIGQTDLTDQEDLLRRQ